MATIGTGRDDQRRWVKAAYHLTDAIERGETGPQGQLPTSAEVSAKLGISAVTMARAYRELIDMGII
jgi:DNA-binding GntR family transcriptional regulator